MTNNDTMNDAPRREHYRLFRRQDGTTGLLRDPLGHCIVVPDAAEVEELALTPEEAQELKRQHRLGKLEFAKARRAYTQRPPKEEQSSTDKM